MEHGFLKAPWEILVRNFRAGHKPVAKELELVCNAVNQLIEQHKSSNAMEVDNVTTKPAMAMPEIAALRKRLTGLKRKLESTRMSDEESILKCQHRIVHLHKRATSANPPSASLPANSKAHLVGLDDLLEMDSPQHEANVTMTDRIGTTKTSTPQAHTPSKRPNPDNNNPTNSNNSDNNVGGENEDESSLSRSTERQSRWEKIGLDRAMVDYMLREGRYETAKKLSVSQGIQHIIDEEMFTESRNVIEALRRRDCKEGLKWCLENKRRLQKVNSKLEFKLRCQEFVELARARRKKDAIQYMRKHLSSPNIDADRFLDIQRFMALLIFHPSTTCQPYKDLYSQHKWQELENVFKTDHYRLHGLTIESSLEILLKAGLSSLKTRKCATQSDRKQHCPTCNEPFVSLAQNLPRSRHENSILVCSISGEIMDENNPPMAMPQGYVYSQKALTKLANDNDGEHIVDPITNSKARLDELRKCFFM